METHEHKLYTASPWSPERRPGSLARIGKTLEEMGESVSALARCMIQGITKSHPVTGKPNQHWVEEEFGDVLAQMDHFIEFHGLDREKIEQRRASKHQFTGGWYAMVDAGLIAHDARIEDVYVTLPGRQRARYIDLYASFIEVGRGGWRLLVQPDLAGEVEVHDTLRVDLDNYTIWDNLNTTQES